VLAYNLNMKAFLLVFLTILFCVSVFGQGPEQGATEIQIWTAGGHSVAGGRGDTGIWNAGLRYGWVLTKPIGPGFLKGRFEYAIEAVPVFVLFQPANTAFGAGVSPLGLKWNFATRGQVAPYFELNGGTLFTSHEVPPGTSKVNFTDAAAFGVQFLGPRHALSLEARYLHISNAGLTNPNPGVNTVEIRLGIGRFKKEK
jgi:hypothetical protein